MKQVFNRKQLIEHWNLGLDSLWGGGVLSLMMMKLIAFWSFKRLSTD
ncbi:hypothetical protein [Helicobacter sp.]|nr:hypothetical protein [Helicobacter sp.]MCI5969174.1 hypothetical protein [Helicobacter sp.]MDY2584976.1 hypothetical protein [Helicobacter sp.]